MQRHPHGLGSAFMTPSSVTFREALSRFASGVVVVTAHTPEGPVGFTASAFSSVSLDPALVLVCVARKASAYAGIVSAHLFGVSILQEGQEWIAAQFARQNIDRFVGVSLCSSARVPLVEGAVAQLECARHALHGAGDHTVLFGEVLEAHAFGGRPLVHYARTFTELATPKAAFASLHDLASIDNEGA
jgi:flavin reductase ActVB